LIVDIAGCPGDEEFDLLAFVEIGDRLGLGSSVAVRDARIAKKDNLAAAILRGIFPSFIHSFLLMH